MVRYQLRIIIIIIIIKVISHKKSNLEYTYWISTLLSKRSAVRYKMRSAATTFHV